MPQRIRFVNAAVQDWDVHVEALEEDEWERLRSVRLAALLDAPEAFGSKHQNVVHWIEPAWREQLRRITTFVAVDAGKDVGMVRGIEHADLPDAAYLVSMWVHPGARKRGVGGALIERVVEWTAASGRTRLFLDVRTYNTAAQRLYRARGFLPTGAREVVEEFTELQFVRQWVSGLGLDS
ncbi:MAG: GNAT family N-acetyltransferase [Nannocystaceae bacterium]|nr:GNAT family N-acetyltransferase [Nannocystaceae bacterium]